MSLQTIFRDTTPTAQSLDANVLDEPDPRDFTEEVRESYCLACQAPVAAFTSWGGDMVHYVGDPMSDDIMPYETDHAPFLP
jgi:hypothetical protein